MGKKVKLIPDPTLAKSHMEGAVVEFVQPALHKLGLIYIGHPIYWSLHASIADSAKRRLEKYINKIIALKPDESNARSIHDIKLIKKIYRASTELITHTYLLFEHFALFVLTSVFLNANATEEDKKEFERLQRLDLKEKVRYIIKHILEKPELINSKGYSMLFQEWEQRRHAINHPTNSNIYNCDGTNWDQVPLAWSVSGKSLDFIKEITLLFGGMLDKWTDIEDKYRIPAELIGVKRGIKSSHFSSIKKER